MPVGEDINQSQLLDGYELEACKQSFKISSQSNSLSLGSEQMTIKTLKSENQMPLKQAFKVTKGVKNSRYSKLDLKKDPFIEIIHDLEESSQETETEIEIESLTQTGSHIVFDEVKSEYISDYLLKLFNKWLKTVLENEKKLFSQDELNILNSFINLNELSQYILLRAYLRKSAWIKQESLEKYCNLEQKNEFNNSIKELVASGIFTRMENEDISLRQLLEMLTLPQLKELTKGEKWFSGFRSKTKNIMIEQVVSHCKTQPTIFGMSGWELKPTQSAGVTSRFSNKENRYRKKCLELLGERFNIDIYVRLCLDRIQLVYFRVLPIQQNHLINAILVKRNKLIYPSYPIKRNKDFFRNRDHLLEYEKASILYHTVLEAYELRKETIYLNIIRDISINCLEDWENEILLQKDLKDTDFRLSFTPGHFYTKIQEYYTKVLGQQKLYEEEVIVLKKLLKQTVFRKKKRGLWYQRLCLILQSHLKNIEGNFNECFSLCLEALEDPILSLDDKYLIYDRLKKLKKCDKTITLDIPDFPIFNTEILIGQRVSNNTRETNSRNIYRLTDGGICNVEELALEHYKRLGYIGYHCEGGLISTLFSFLFWDILFMETQEIEALETEFLSCPADLYYTDFYYNRKSAIEAQLKSIENGEATNILNIIYNREAPNLPRVTGLNWAYPLSILSSLASFLPTQGLVLIMKKLATNYSQYHSGFPDLTLIHPTSKHVIFAEVKSPNDSLSFKQKVWLKDLSENKVDARLVLVKHLEDGSFVDPE